MFGEKSGNEVSEDRSGLHELEEQVQERLEELLIEIEKGGAEFTLCYALAYCVDSEKDLDNQGEQVFIEALKKELGENSELEKVFNPMFVSFNSRVPLKELRQVASIKEIHTSSNNIVIRRYTVVKLGTIAVTIGPKILKYQ